MDAADEERDILRFVKVRNGQGIYTRFSDMVPPSVHQGRLAVCSLRYEREELIKCARIDPRDLLRLGAVQKSCWPPPTAPLYRAYRGRDD